MSLYKTYKSGEEEFEDNFCYENSDNETIIRYELCQNPNKLQDELKQFRKQEYISIIKGEIERLEGQKKKVIPNMLQDDEMFLERGMDGVKGYNQAISDQISHLQSELLLIEKDK